MHANGHQHDPLPPPSEEALTTNLEAVAQALGDTPETVIALQFLREGSAEVLCVGLPEDYEGLIVQSREMPEEPTAFGTNAAAIAELLPHLSGWACINVPAHMADDLVEPVAQVADATGVLLRDDIYHVLNTPVPSELVGNARLLTPEDRALLAAAPAALIGTMRERLLATLETGHVAAVIERGNIVALAHTFATSERHADIGVVTHPDWRGHGFGIQVSACVAQAIQADGRVPVWSCGAPNLPSLAIARRLGFEEVSRRIYLIPEWDDE